MTAQEIMKLPLGRSVGTQDFLFASAVIGEEEVILVVDQQNQEVMLALTLQDADTLIMGLYEASAVFAKNGATQAN